MKKFSIAIFFSWLLRFITIGILIQTLYFKFSGAEESVYIFTTMKMEPWGRIGTGVFELIASIMLLFPNSVIFGSALSIGLMSGAILSHLTVLGIEIHGDGGLLFFLALIVFIINFIILFLERETIRDFIIFAKQKKYSSK